MIQARKRLENAELEKLRAKISSKEYLFEAVNCLAMILSTEMQDIPQEGADNGRAGRKQPT
jgi:LytS/YehU family sensor histidine kinase